MIERIIEEGEEYCPCTKCNDDDCKDGCSYYMKYLSADTPTEAKKLFLEAEEDFQNMPYIQLLQKKRKVRLDIAESKRITKNQNKGQECHDRKIML